MIKRVFLMTLLALCTSAFAKGVQHIVWDKTPLHILLSLNQERLIRFPLAISIVDSELDDYAGVMKVQDALYINPHKAFHNKRLVVQLMPGGEALVLTLSASADIMEATPIEVLMAEDADKDDSEDRALPKISRTNPDINAISLTRFAIQSLYSPERLLVTPPGVSRTPMHARQNTVVVYGASVLARPLISWQGADLWVTAIELKNQLNKTVVIDPRQLIGEWQTATLYPTNTLSARGSKETTTLFVTSSKPFGEAIARTKGFVR